MGTKVSGSNELGRSVSSENIYMIKNVPVSYSSTDAKKAKEEAIKIGQRQALKLLFKRGNINENYTKFLDDNIISEMVETIRISDEIITKESYSGKLTILFNKEFINFNLKKLGIGVNTIKDEIYLYIPVFEDKNGRINAVDGNDIWYKTAYDNYFENNYQNIFIIDNYSLSNSGLISTNKIKDPNYNSFKTLLKKYESNVVIIAVARYNVNEDFIEINFKKINAEGVEEKILGFANKEGLPVRELIKEASIKTLEFLNNESQTKMMEDRKDEKGLIKVKKNNHIDVQYVIPDLGEYVYVKTLITNLDFITKYETLEITTKTANIRLYYKGDESEIVSLFSNKGFALITRGGKNFITYKGF
jgi:hypothetical protein